MAAMSSRAADVCFLAVLIGSFSCRLFFLKSYWFFFLGYPRILVYIERISSGAVAPWSLFVKKKEDGRPV